MAMELAGRTKTISLAYELGVSEPAISQWKNGKPISLENACELALVLDVSLDWLLLGRCEHDIHKKLPTKTSHTSLVLALEATPPKVQKALKIIIDRLVN